MDARDAVNAKVKRAHTAFRTALESAKEYWGGRWIVITDPHFNGQPFGHSKPSLAGREYRVRSVYIDPSSPHEDRRILLFVDECRTGLHLSQVREKHGR